MVTAKKSGLRDIVELGNSPDILLMSFDNWCDYLNILADANLIGTRRKQFKKYFNRKKNKSIVNLREFEKWLKEKNMTEDELKDIKTKFKKEVAKEKKEQEKAEKNIKRIINSEKNKEK